MGKKYLALPELNQAEALNHAEALNRTEALNRAEALHRNAAMAPLVITGGDPAGIGPELVLALAGDFVEYSAPLVYFSTGGPAHAEEASAACLAQGGEARLLSRAELHHVFPDAGASDAHPDQSAPRPRGIFIVDAASEAGLSPVAPGRPCEDSGAAAFAALEGACDFIKHAGSCAGLLTAPISKEWIARSGIPGFHGHTDYLGERFNSATLMLMHGPNFSVIPLTVHIPLVEAGLELRRVLGDEEQFALLREVRELPFFSQGPWAFCGLNPHAGEGGLLGREETEFLSAGIAAWTARGLPLEGPIPADAVFMEDNLKRYRLILGCYHDQVLIPFKALEGRRGINCTIGLPFPRSSPDHGTAFELAGKKACDPLSMREAFRYLLGADTNTRRLAGGKSS